MTALILAVFRLNGRLLSAGDELVADLGLTSARWQILGAVALSESPLPVAHVARNMGLTRQAVQRVVNELKAQGFVAFEANPHHLRAKLVTLTAKGLSIYQSAAACQTPWVNDLADGLSLEDVQAALRVARAVTKELEAGGCVADPNAGF